MVEIYSICLNERQGSELYPLMLNYVSPSKREAVSRYHQPIDAQRSLMGEILARLGICSRLQITNDELNFSKNEFGKPELSHYSGFHFNISHAGDKVVCAFSERPVGVDIEHIKPIDFSIADRFFTRNEYLALMSRTGLDQLTYFYRLWTLKESYIKAVGKGLSIPLDSFSFEIGDNDEVSATLEAGATPCYFKQYLEYEGYVLSLCSYIDVIPVIKQLDYEKLRTYLEIMKAYC